MDDGKIEETIGKIEEELQVENEQMVERTVYRDIEIEQEIEKNVIGEDG